MDKGYEYHKGYIAGMKRAEEIALKVIRAKREKEENLKEKRRKK